ncbi:response regulator [Chloroflexota bacterium]
MIEPVSILVVDDNEDLLETFSLILKRRGFNVSTAENGVAAVDKYKAQHFDVTLMDIVMPKMNGVEAFRRIREISPGATVILMTAYSEEELIRVALEEGAHRVVNKPIRIDQLIELIKEAAQAQPILVVDDDEDICKTLTRALEMEGYQVLSAGSGEEALSLAREKSCQLAFIDIKLPHIDGLETYLRLKEINPNITIVLMTGYRDEVKDALEKAQAASAITCLFKPFDPLEAVGLAGRVGERANQAGS